MTRYYRCVDRVPGTLPGSRDADGSHYMAEITGEYRPPRAGEWYISGAIPEAYRMPGDSTIPQHIARLVRVRRVEVIEPMP
jgi:hypothetical protein